MINNRNTNKNHEGNLFAYKKAVTTPFRIRIMLRETSVIGCTENIGENDHEKCRHLRERFPRLRDKLHRSE